MRRRKFISILLTTLFIMMMVIQPVFANVSDMNNQLDTVKNSKPFKNVSSELEHLGYKPNIELTSSEIVMELPNGKELDTPVKKVLLPFSNQDETVDLIYVKVGEQEYVSASIEMRKKESKSMIEEMINKQYVKNFIDKLKSKGYEINYDNISGSKRIVSDATDKNKEIIGVAVYLTKNNENIGLITFANDGVIVALTYDDNKAYLLKNDGSLESKTRTKTSTDFTIQEDCEGSDCFWYQCMLTCLCGPNVTGQCIAFWSGCALSCIACWCGGVLALPACITCLACESGLAYCLYDCW